MIFDYILVSGKSGIQLNWFREREVWLYLWSMTNISLTSLNISPGIIKIYTNGKRCLEETNFVTGSPVLSNATIKSLKIEFNFCRKLGKKLFKLQSSLYRFKSDNSNYWLPKLRFYWFLNLYHGCGNNILQVPITRSANIFALQMIRACKNNPHNFELSRLDCTFNHK